MEIGRGKLSMRLLFATSLLPETNAFSGYEIANRSIVNGLVALGCEVVPVGFANPGQSAAVLPGSINLGELAIVTGEAETRQKLAWLSRAVARNTTFAAAKLQVIAPEHLQAIISKAGPFDGVVLNGVTLAAAYEAQLTNIPFVYVAHNVEWQSARQSAAAASGFVERLLFEREARLLKSIEARLVGKARFVFGLAADDLSALGVPAGRGAVLPVLVHENAPEAAPRAPTCDAALIGTWSWAPNRIGLDWFLREVVPHLPEGFTVAIAGKLPNPPETAHAGVRFVGRVPDARHFVRSARVLPLISRAGTGVQLKTLEAFELGLPTVATAHSVRGVANLPANCILADAPEAFAAALVRACRDVPMADTDGRAFHAARSHGLQAALAEGVAALAQGATSVRKALAS
jgi:hypothetical protein